jgi:hypothetical protein
MTEEICSYVHGKGRHGRERPGIGDAESLKKYHGIFKNQDRCQPLIGNFRTVAVHIWPVTLGTEELFGPFLPGVLERCGSFTSLPNIRLHKQLGTPYTW